VDQLNPSTIYSPTFSRYLINRLALVAVCYLIISPGQIRMSRNPRPLESLLLPLKPESLQFVYSPLVDDLLRIDVYTD
jgi:hypothetical protein